MAGQDDLDQGTNALGLSLSSCCYASLSSLDGK